ncbi:Glycosyltransferase involved in cell wall bisynthesis [Thermosyntropha lipolytica DSM 11003]|uniref:Glycosyltransferase involved in cell wall bisynthesis n=1 Tax=Thermosyntropha lipolytica DSM 11003 TaxID=1123382 RepID=A0A1M5RMJ4_9FIRM|nr:glycosyltransferase [Thermosyntropha lipolytica]SHH27346.1 Glycosyltransferase involved in cell wall bisynthesis [Thermosyntropha lipolytica DSM 11003]
MKISACIIAKNEEKNIGRCIKSYREVVDEIILVDTGSTDMTVEIAKELGAKVYYFEWINDFAAAKNFAIKKAKGNWIIFLDADEYFAEGTAKNIPNLIKKCQQNGSEIIACKMMNIDEEKGINIADFVQARIFKNNGDICYTSPIHERLYSRKKKKLKALYAEEKELLIYHTGYSSTTIIDKAKRNLELLLKEIDKPEPDPSAYFFISDSYLTLKEYEKSIYYGKLFLANKVNLTGLNSKVYQNIISAMVELKYDEQEIEEFIKEAQNNFPHHPIFYLYMAQSYERQRKYRAALASYRRTLELQKNYDDFEINFITGKEYEIYTFMANLHYLMNEEDKALESYINALKQKKDYRPALRGLLRLAGSLMPEEDIILLLNQLYDKNDKSDMLILLEEITRQRFKKALAYYVSWMYKNYNHEDFSLVVMFLTNENHEKAFKHFYEAYLLEYDSNFARLAAVAACLSGEKEKLKELAIQVKPSLKRIIQVLVHEDEAGLYKEDLQEYIDLLGEFIKIGKEEPLSAFLLLQDKFRDNIGNLELVIGDVLKDNLRYGKAIEQYRKAAAKGENVERAWLQMGYCFYKMRNFKEAIECFEEAYKAGYRGNDLQEFLIFTSEQAGDEDIKQKVETLLNEWKIIKETKE